MDYVELKLGDLLPNPYRELGSKPFKALEPGRYRLEAKRIKELEQSIHDTDLWKNLIVRENQEGKYEIAYGHHRIQAAINVLGVNHRQPFVIEDWGDWQMIQIMGNENSESWGMPVKHANLCVRQARDYLDGVLDRCGTSSEFTDEINFSGDFFGPDERRYVQARHEGAGRKLIQECLSGVFRRGAAVQLALQQIGPSEKERRSKEEKLERERKEHFEAEEKARKAREKADEKAEKLAVQHAKERAEEARKLELASAQDEFYDPQAGEVFDRPAHAEAFRKAVCRPNIMEYLPEDKQVDFAESIKETLTDKTLGDRVTAPAISEKVSSTFKQFLKREDKAKAKVDHTFAVRNHLRHIGTDLSYLGNELKRLMEFTRDNDAPVLLDVTLQNFHDAASKFVNNYVEFCRMIGEEDKVIQKRLVR